MFASLLAVTFIISLVTCFLVGVLFKRPIHSIMDRIVADEISSAWLKYLTFAIYVVGLSGGVRIWDLENYITRVNLGAEVVTLNADRWILEVYRTIIGTLQSLAWMLLVFFLFALIAYVIVRFREVKQK